MRESQLRSRVRNGKTRFYASVNGEQVQLGPKKGAAEKQLKELLNGRPKQIGPNPRVEELIDKFLTWSAKNNEPGTYAWYKLHLDHFKAFLPSGLHLAQLKRFHLTNWLSERYPGTSANYRNGAGRCAKRAIQWCEDEQLIEVRSPLAKAKLPEPERRELTIDETQWQALLKLLENRWGHNYDDFRDFLTVIWETGCRPYEARIVEAKFFDRANRCWRFPTKLSKGKKSPAYRISDGRSVRDHRAAGVEAPRGTSLSAREGRPVGEECHSVQVPAAEGQVGFAGAMQLYVAALLRDADAASRRGFPRRGEADGAHVNADA